jgi:sugar lactone lactonase YvrE
MHTSDFPRALTAQLFHQAACTLGEGLFWFQDQLWWVDIEEGCLHTVLAGGQHPQSYRMGQRIGSCVPINAQKFVVALQEGIGVWCRETGSTTMLAAPEADIPGSRFNEGKCDPSGRFLAGTINLTGQENTSALYALQLDGSLRKLVPSVTISNGLAWSRSGRTLYYIDTPTFEVAAFDYDPETGSLGSRTTVVKIPKNAGCPDGMDIDKDGNLWIAHWDGWTVRCWSPATGRCLAEVHLPCQRPTSCCFGGPNYDQLFITTARVGLTANQLKYQPLAGSIFVCSTDTHGFPMNPCSLSFSIWKR